MFSVSFKTDVCGFHIHKGSGTLHEKKHGLPGGKTHLHEHCVVEEKKKKVYVELVAL